MFRNLYIFIALCFSATAFAQSNTRAHADTMRLEVKQAPQASNYQDLDPLMIAPPKKLYLPLRPSALPLSMYSAPSDVYSLSDKKQTPMQNQNLDNFYKSFNVSRNQMLERNMVWDIMGMSASAFVWGMVVKQAIEGKPNPNVKQPAPTPQPRKPIN